jgi:hypothetical protein
MARSSAKLVSVTKIDSAEGAHARRSRDGAEFHAAGGPRQFPVASTSPRMPVMIPDEKLDYYGWLFLQGGFPNLNMTFEQFLMVVAAVKPSGLAREVDVDAPDFSCD